MEKEFDKDELQDDLLLGSDDEEEIISDLDDDMILDEETLKIAEAYLSDEEEEEDIDFGSEDEEEEAELDFEDRPKRRFYDEEDVEVADEIDFGESKETDSAMLTEMAESPEGFVVGKFCKVRDKHGHNDCVSVIRDIYFEHKKPAKTRLTLLTFPYNHDDDQIKYDTSYEIIQYDENGNVDVSADFIATKAKSAIGKSYLSWLNQPSLADARSTLRRRGIQGFVFSDKKRVNGRIIENFIVEAPAFMDIVTFKRFDYVDESRKPSHKLMLHEGRKPRHFRRLSEKYAPTKRGIKGPRYNCDESFNHSKARKSRMMKEAVRQARRNHKLQESRKMRSPFSKKRFH